MPSQTRPLPARPSGSDLASGTGRERLCRSRHMSGRSRCIGDRRASLRHILLVEFCGLISEPGLATVGRFAVTTSTHLLRESTALVISVTDTGRRETEAYHVMQPVRTLGLLALVRFLGGSGGVPAGDGDGLDGLLLGSRLERLEEEWWDMVSSTARDANRKGIGSQGQPGSCSFV